MNKSEMAQDTMDRITRVEEGVKTLTLALAKIEVQMKDDHIETQQSLKEILEASRGLPERVAVVQREQEIINKGYIEVKLMVEDHSKYIEGKRANERLIMGLVSLFGVSNVIIIGKFIIDLLAR